MVLGVYNRVDQSLFPMVYILGFVYTISRHIFPPRLPTRPARVPRAGESHARHGVPVAFPNLISRRSVNDGKVVRGTCPNSAERCKLVLVRPSYKSRRINRSGSDCFPVSSATLIKTRVSFFLGDSQKTRKSCSSQDWYHHGYHWVWHIVKRIELVLEVYTRGICGDRKSKFFNHHGT